MCKDGFDKLCWLLLATACAAMAALLLTGGGASDRRAAGPDKAFEREMAYRARVEMTGKIYEPVEVLRREGNSQAALLKLDELIRKYPGEAHGHILQGQMLLEMGALDEAAASFVEGVRLNGDYVDAKSPLSRRDLIRKVVDEGLKSAGARAAANPDNRSLATSLRRLNYLKSRLAGGCE